MLSWKPPKDVSEIRSFLGMARYYRRFIEGFSKLAKPMTALLEKNAKFIWSKECQASFEELKKKRKCLRASAARWKTRRGSIIPLSSRLVPAVPVTTTSRALSLALHISQATKDSSRMSGTAIRVSRRASATTTIKCSAPLARRLARMPQHHQALARTPTLSQ